MKSSILWYLASFVLFMGLLVGATFLRAWQVNGPKEDKGSQEASHPWESSGHPSEGPGIVGMSTVDPSRSGDGQDNSLFFERINLEDTTERMLAVLECAGCHQQAYDNWKDGPHAASYMKLMESWEKIESSGHFPVAYTDWTRANINICFSCHASENVFETTYAGVEDEKDVNNISYLNYPSLFKMASPRKDKETWSMGTDCFTCHYNGERIITGPEFKPKAENSAMEGYCNPMPSAFFTSNSNCNACHAIQVDHTMRFFGNGQPAKLQSNESNCLSCHQEYDSKGKGTHYFYWRHDDPNKHPRKIVKGGIFQALKTKIVKKDEPKLVIDWANDLYPHNFSECGEIAVFIKVKNAFDQVLFETDVRLNRKIFHDPILQDQMEGEEPPGKMGYAFNPGAEPFHLELPLGIPKVGSGSIELEAIDKGQYWGNDAIGDTIWADVRYF